MKQVIACVARQTVLTIPVILLKGNTVLTYRTYHNLPGLKRRDVLKLFF